MNEPISNQLEVIIMRGLPGSGKSYWLRNYRRVVEAARRRMIVCSADDGHINEAGVYKYKAENAAKAHTDCFNRFDTMMPGFGINNGIDVLAVDNTNTSMWELAPYYRLAEARGYKPRIVLTWCEVAVACRRNVHNVPSSTILAMYRNLVNELPPAWWKQEVYCEGDR